MNIYSLYYIKHLIPDIHSCIWPDIFSNGVNGCHSSFLIFLTEFCYSQELLYSCFLRKALNFIGMDHYSTTWKVLEVPCDMPVDALASHELRKMGTLWACRTGQGLFYWLLSGPWRYCSSPQSGPDCPTIFMETSHEDSTDTIGRGIVHEALWIFQLSGWMLISASPMSFN